MKKSFVVLSLLLVATCARSSEPSAAAAPKPVDAAASAQLAGEVKAEFLHAWRDYRK